MQLTDGVGERIISYLLNAEKECREVVKVTDAHPELTVEQAYVLQRQLIERKIANGSRRIGVKLGLTSEAKQNMMGVHESIYGYLLSGMLALEWDPIQFDRLIHPKAEPEIAFLLGEDLSGTTVTAEDVRKATKFVAPAIEIIDSRYLNFKFTLADVVADNCSSARFIVGSKMVPVQHVDLPSLGMVMMRNGEVATTGAGAAVLGDPAEAVAWAVNKLGARGEGLKQGDIVLSGALSEAISFQPGDTVHAQFDGLGSVSFSCKS